MEKELQVEEEPKAEEPQTKNFTQEEVDALVEETRNIEQEKYKGIQRSISKKDIQIEALQKQSSAPAQTDDDLLGMLVSSMKGKQNEYGETDPTIANLEKELASRKQRKQQEGQQVQWESYCTTEKAKMDARITEAGLDPDDERFETVDDAFAIARTTTADFSNAQKRLDRILNRATLKTPEKETPEAVNEKKGEDKKLEMKEKGQASVDNIAGSGGIGSNDAEFKKGIGNGSLPLNKENMKRLKEMGFR